MKLKIPCPRKLTNTGAQRNNQKKKSSNNEKIELFDVARKDIDNPKIVCKRHYDFVYLVYLEQPYDFVFDKGEFHDAKWVSFETAASMVKTPAFKSMMKYLRDLK
jgi:hypothetical protein